MSSVIPEPLSDRALADLVRVSNDAVTATTPAGIITAWNRAAERLYGYSEREAVGRTIDMLVPDDRRREAQELFTRLAGGERVEHFDTQCRTRDGRIVDVTVTASAVRGADGEVAGFFASSHEVGAEKRLRDQLERSQALLESAQKLTAVGSWQFSFADRSVEWSREMFRILGRDPETFVPSPACLHEVPHPDDRESVRAIIAEAVAARREFAVHARIVRPDGSERIVEARARVVVDEQGEPASIVGSVQDVTEAESDRRALLAAEERFRTAFAEAPVGIGLLDLEGRYLEVNAALCSLLGRSEAELVGRHREELIHPADVPEARRGLAGLLSGAIAAHSAEIRFSAVGHEVTTASRIVLIRTPEGGPRHFLCQLQDVTEERRAEEAVRASEARLRSILDALPASVFIKDLEGRYTLVNQAFAEAGGTTAEAALGTRTADHIDPAMAARYAAEDAVVQTNRESVSIEEELPVAGELRTFRTVKFPLVDEGGRPYAIGGIAVDVTDRRRERDELIESRALLTEAQRIGRVGSWTWDVQSNTVRWSEEQFRIYGRPVSPYALTFEEAMEPVHPADHARLHSAARRTAELGERLSMTYRLLWPDGSVRTVRSRGEVVTDRAGQPVRVVGTTQDVTREVEREAEIRQLARRNEVVLESVGEGICGVDRSGRTTFVNAAGARLLGWRAEDLIGTDLHEAAYHTRANGHPRGRAGSPILKTARDGNERRASGEVFFRRDGSRLPVELTCRPTHEDGELTGAVVSFRDVSERDAAHRELQSTLHALQAAHEQRRRLLAHLVTAQEDERRRIAADIHDDSVQAMSAVALELEALRADLPAGERRSMTLDRLHESVVGAVGRLRTLLFELAPPELEHGGLAAAIDALLLQLGREAGVEHQIRDELAVEPSTDCRLIVYRIAQEAVANVRKHARADRVFVRLASRDDGVLLRVRDDGAGFDPRRAHRSHGHLGILAMTHRAEMASGAFDLHSRPGAGTTVTAWIPCSA